MSATQGINSWRAMLALVLLCHGPAALAGDADLGNIFLFSFDKNIDDGVKMCAARDPEDANAITTAWNGWSASHAAGLGELRSGRNKFSAWMKAQALDPKSSLTIEQRAVYFSGLDVFYEMSSAKGYKKLALQRDAETTEQCKQLLVMFKTMPPDAMLADALTAMRKTLAEIDEQK